LGTALTGIVVVIGPAAAARTLTASVGFRLVLQAFIKLDAR
jgi:hypothetical protein